MGTSIMKRSVLLAPGALALTLNGAPLETKPECVRVPTEWADGDSFLVRFPSGEEHTIRLYGADCLEWHVTDGTDERRLRAQRRYFGISAAAPTPRESIELAMRFGEMAAREVARVLQRPFTVHTAFADGRGDGRYKRIYAFVTTADGKDLATHLVSIGLARAYGVSRQTPDGRSRDEYRNHLIDLELRAAKRGVGAWEKTNWDTLPEERRDQRREDEEAAIVFGRSPLGADDQVDPNNAARDELMRLPGIGETLANRIIEGRPYGEANDLLGVPGIGQATLDRIRPLLSFGPADGE